MRWYATFYFAVVLMIGIVPCAIAGEIDANFSDWVEPGWVNPLENFEGEVRVLDIGDVAEVRVLYSYPNGEKGKITANKDENDVELFRYSIPAEVDAGLGVMVYSVEVSHGTNDAKRTESEPRMIRMGYEEDLDITANPPEILWFELGDKSAVVRYTACCNILGASIIAKRVPVNPMESGKGLPGKLYSDFVWLEPDALSASTAGLHFEWGFKAEDFEGGGRNYPVIYEYDWLDEVWEPVLTFKIVDGKVLDFPATEGGVYVLGKE